ncbi:hypothetical protein CTI14_52745 [Methylobacterium radiotolerans]|nr:hypothetical protein CTI14_52745 [Methylobacterium radiotolerans]
MVDIGGPWSRELCAGTHVSTSAEIGPVRLRLVAALSSDTRTEIEEITNRAVQDALEATTRIVTLG